MANEEKNVRSVLFYIKDYPNVVRIANELAQLENRKPHDSIRILIEEEGQKKIDRLKAEAAPSQQ